MRHFVGGYAVGVVVIFFWVLERAKQNAGYSFAAGVIFGWIFGLAAWGLLP